MDILEASKRARVCEEKRERERQSDIRVPMCPCMLTRKEEKEREREREREGRNIPQRCQKALVVFRGISAGCLETSTLSRRYRVCHDAARHPRQASEGGLEGGGRATCCVVSDATG